MTARRFSVDDVTEFIVVDCNDQVIDANPQEDATAVQIVLLIVHCSMQINNFTRYKCIPVGNLCRNCHTIVIHHFVAFSALYNYYI